MIKHVKLIIDAVRFSSVKLNKETQEFLDNHMISGEDWDALRKRYGISDLRKIPDCVRYEFLNNLVKDFNSLNVIREGVISVNVNHVHTGVSVAVGMEIDWDHPDVKKSEVKPKNTLTRQEAIESKSRTSKVLSSFDDNIINFYKKDNQNTNQTKIDFPFSKSDLINLKEMEEKNMITQILFGTNQK